MMTRVLFFSLLREVVGVAEMNWPHEGPLTVEQLFAALVEQHPALAAWRSSLLVAVDQTYVRFDAPIMPGSEVAFMPPVQGG